MRFTIVTPSFGQLDWLELCIASVADQLATRAETGNLKPETGEGRPETGNGRVIDAGTGGIFIEHIVQDAGTPGIEEFARRMGAGFYQDGKKVFSAQCSVDGEFVGAEDTKVDSAQYTSWSLRRPVSSNLGSVDGESVGADGGNVERKGYSLTIYSEKDEGMYDAINKGLRKATGDVCAYLNCDEQYLPGTLAAAAEWFGSNKSSDVVFGDIVVVDPQGNYICDRTAMVPTKLHTLVSGNLAVYSAATFFRREAVVDRGLLFSPDWKVVGDSVWILSLLDAGLKMGLLRRRVASFIYSGENLSLDAKGEQERAKLRATASPLARASASAIVAFFRMRRLLAGGYSLPSQDYAIFTEKSGPRREVFEVKQPTHRWPRQ